LPPASAFAAPRCRLDATAPHRARVVSTPCCSSTLAAYTHAQHGGHRGLAAVARTRPHGTVGERVVPRSIPSRGCVHGHHGAYVRTLVARHRRSPTTTAGHPFAESMKTRHITTMPCQWPPMSTVRQETLAHSRSTLGHDYRTHAHRARVADTLGTHTHQQGSPCLVTTPPVAAVTSQPPLCYLGLPTQARHHGPCPWHVSLHAYLSTNLHRCVTRSRGRER
jgi:hypothetical protein